MFLELKGGYSSSPTIIEADYGIKLPDQSMAKKFLEQFAKKKVYDTMNPVMYRCTCRCNDLLLCKWQMPQTMLNYLARYFHISNMLLPTIFMNYAVQLSHRIREGSHLKRDREVQATNSKSITRRINRSE
jgi:hypothetical protein